MNKKAFTLFEVVLALIIFSLFIGIIFNSYKNIKTSEYNIKNNQIIITEANNILDTIKEFSLGYTIDYEEYFNRSIVGCNSDGGSWEPNESCSLFTNYGSFTGDGLYYCSALGDGHYGSPGYDYYKLNDCIQPGQQNFNQYYYTHRNIEYDLLNNGNDIFLGDGPLAIKDNTGVQELYLISQDQDHRVFFRRKYITGHDINGDGSIDLKNEKLYTIQILKLKGFDAGRNHDFEPPDEHTLQDGFIDTRACDIEEGFVCSGSDISGGYTLPLNNDDGREDITDQSITISDWNIEIRPAKDPYLNTNNSGYLLDPYIKINMSLNIFGKITQEQIDLQTSIGFKNNYFNFEKIQYSGFLNENP